MPQTRIYTWGLRGRPTPKRWREALRLPLNGWITPKSGAETPFAGAQSRLSLVTLPTPDANRPSKVGRLRVSALRGRTTIDNLPEVPNPLNGGLAASDRGGCGLPEACCAPRPRAIILGTTQAGFGLRGCRWSLALENLRQEQLRTVLGRVREEQVRRVLFDYLSTLHEDEPVGHLLGEPHLVGHHHHRHAG